MELWRSRCIRFCLTLRSTLRRLRTGDEAALALKRLAANSPLWLSSVVLEELYAGVVPPESACTGATGTRFRKGEADPGAESQ